MSRIGAQLRTPLGFILLAFGLVTVTPSDAWAYVDPGTGSYLFQLAAAAFLAGAYTMRRYWYALTMVLRGRSAAAGSCKPTDTRGNDLE